MPPHVEPSLDDLPQKPLDYVFVGISSVFLMLMAVSAWARVVLLRCVLWQPHPLGWPLDLEIVAAGFRACAGRGKAVHMRLMLAASSWLSRLWPGTRITWQDAGGVPAFWVGLAGAGRPSAASAREKDLVLFYVHGGGFIAGHALMCTQSFWYWARCLQQQGISCQVLCVQYPLAPEQPFPAAVAATAACYTWLTQQLQGSKARIIGVGDSAGGNLLIASLAGLRDLHSQRIHQQQQQSGHDGSKEQRVAPLASAAEPAGPAAADPGGGTAALFAALTASLSRLRDSSSPGPLGFAPPAAVVLVSPVVDLGSSACWHDDAWTAAHEEAFDYLPHRLLGGSMRVYAGGSGSDDELLLAAPHVSLVNLPSLAGLVAGPWLLLAGGAELLARDIDRFAARLRVGVGGAGVQHVVEPHMPHSWAIMPTPSMWPRQARSVVVFLVQQVAGGGGAG